MRFVLSIVLSLALVSVGAFFGIQSLNHQFDQDRFAWISKAASGALFVDQANGKRRFICSGTTIGHTDTGDALFLTARHCVWENPSIGDESTPPTPGGLVGLEEVSFSSNEAGPYYTAIPWKISKTDDVAILVLKNGGGLPAVKLGDERLLYPGEILKNYTF